MGLLHNWMRVSSDLYDSIFSEWLYIPFFVRTVILVLILCIIVYLFAQVCHYLLIPYGILFYYNVIFRAWNFLFTETFREFIYIFFYADGKPFLSKTYLRLCDKVKENRMRLAHTRYAGIIRSEKVKKAATHLMVIMLTVTILWTVALGLYNQFVFH